MCSSKKKKVTNYTFPSFFLLWNLSMQATAPECPDEHLTPHFQKTLKINQGGICYLRNSSSFKITDILSEKVLTLKQKKGLWQMYVKKIENQSSNGWNKSCCCLHIISILYLFRTMRIKSLKEAEKLPGNLCY